MTWPLQSSGLFEVGLPVDCKRQKTDTVEERRDGSSRASQPRPATRST